MDEEEDMEFGCFGDGWERCRFDRYTAVLIVQDIRLHLLSALPQSLVTSSFCNMSSKDLYLGGSV